MISREKNTNVDFFFLNEKKTHKSTQRTVSIVISDCAVMTGQMMERKDNGGAHTAVNVTISI